MSLPHTNLVAWQRADDLFIEVHRLTLQRFPNSERFELGSQLRRAAWSIPANIVEGTADGMSRESIRFLRIARRSLNELGYGLHAAARLGYLSVAELEVYEQKLQAIGGPLQGLINKRRAKLGLAGGVALLAIVGVTMGAL